MRTHQFIIILVWSTLWFPSFVHGQGFVYPVGNENIAPSRPPCPTANGYRITQGFQNTEKHTGVDLCTCSPNCQSGGEVRAIGPGSVTKINTCGSPTGACGREGDSNFGNAVLIQHNLPGGPFYSLYGHLLDDSVGVKVGDPVAAGTPIGKVGNTGNSEAPHLHFAVKLENSIRCGYIRKEPCLSSDSFANYRDPLQFIADRAFAPLTQPVAIDFRAVISAIRAFDINDNQFDPSVIIGSTVGVGDIITGSFVYDLSVNVDVLPDNSIFGIYQNAPICANFSVGGLNVNIDPSVSGFLNIRNNVDFDFGPSDQFTMRAVNNNEALPTSPIAGTIFGGRQLIDLSFSTLNPTVLTSDSMQVMPSVEWEQVRRLAFEEVMEFDEGVDVLDLVIEANITSFRVTIGKGVCIQP